MEHLLSFRFKNWQGCFTLTQSPVRSFFSHFLRKASSVISKCAEMRFISWLVKVGVMVLQQLAQARQSVSAQTSLSVCTARLSNPRGGFFSSLVKNLLKAGRLAIILF